MRIKHPTSIWQSLDWTMILMYLALVIAGWFSICGATHSPGEDLLTWGDRPMMQLVWMTLGLVLGGAVLMVRASLFEELAPLLYVLMLLLCLVTIFVAPDIKGSRSWLVMGPIRLQPAEFTKVATALMLAWRCSRLEFRIGSPRSYLQVSAIIMAPVLLILGQSETGSALVFFALFLALYREGFTGLFMGIGGAATMYFVTALILGDTVWWGATDAGAFVITTMIIVFTLLLVAIYGRLGAGLQYMTLGLVGVLLLGWVVTRFIYAFNMVYLSGGLLLGLVGYLVALWVIQVGRRYADRYVFIALFGVGSVVFALSTDYVFDQVLEPHQQVRIKIALGVEDDPQGKGYNVEQSKIAIGSGGLWGKGFLEGTQTKLSYVPEQDTDFIFCTVGEEQGFIGSVVLIAGYLIFILRIQIMAERQTSLFGRVYGYCVCCIFLFHLVINVGMVLGLLPVIGIPLPFFSYGGSSLWGFSFMLFIFLGIDGRRNNRHL